jgi:hypothetical protein
MDGNERPKKPDVPREKATAVARPDSLMIVVVDFELSEVTIRQEEIIVACKILQSLEGSYSPLSGPFLGI